MSYTNIRIKITKEKLCKLILWIIGISVSIYCYLHDMTVFSWLYIIIAILALYGMYKRKGVAK